MYMVVRVDINVYPHSRNIDLLATSNADPHSFEQIRLYDVCNAMTHCQDLFFTFHINVQR
jgi:hypothetical protein